MTTQTVLIIPDLQVPLHDQRFIDKLLNVAEYVRPDRLVYIGDLTDSTEVGRWVRDKSGEHTGDLQKAFDDTAKVVAAFREATGEECEHILVDSNHDERTRKYIEDNAPALSSLRALDLRSLIGLDESGVKYLRGPVDIAPGVVAVHGHERAYSSVPMKYGVEAVKAYGKSVVYGHTHQAGLVFHNTGHSGRLTQRFAMNVGHGMNLRKAGYLKDGYANWTQAFGLLHVEGQKVHPELITAREGKFLYQGVMY